MLKEITLAAIVAVSMSAGSALAHNAETKYVHLAFNQEFNFGLWDDWTDPFQDGGNYAVGSDDWVAMVSEDDYNAFMASNWAVNPSKGFFE